jgi:hypothetical protein
LLPGAQLPAILSKLHGDALARVHVMFHAVSSLDVARSILRHGFVALASTDDGYFGHGIYFSHNLDVRFVIGLRYDDCNDGVISVCLYVWEGVCST